MSDQFIEFEWTTYEPGYRTIFGERLDGGEVEEALIEDLARPGSWRIHHPLREQTGLFKLFAATPPTVQGIIAFANRFGLLGQRKRYRVFHEDYPFESGGSAEPLGIWRREIASVRDAVELWDALRKPRTSDARIFDLVSSLLRYVEAFDIPEPDPLVTGGFPSIDLHEGREARMSEFIAQLEAGKGRLAGSFLLPKIVSARLQVLTASTLVANGDDETDLELVITPRTLGGLIWLQLARAISGNIQHRTCQADDCGRWFEVSTSRTGLRKNRRYCSDACRMRTLRHRQGDARRLATEGRSPEEIAGALGSPVDVIRGWLAPHRLRGEKRQPRKSRIG